MTEPVRRMPVEFRAAPDLGEGIAVGYVTTYGNDYAVGYGVKERIAPHAFDESLNSGRSLPIFWNHGWDSGPLGYTRSIVSDAQGIRAEAQLFMSDQRARNIWEAMQADALREWSISFTADAEDIGREQPGLEIINRGKLLEASVVMRGANPMAETVSVRSGEVTTTNAGTITIYVGDQGEKPEARKKYSKDQRDQMAKAGTAMADGSFPIADAEDLDNAIGLAGNASDPAAARRHIIKRATALGLASKIPDTWNPDGTLKSNSADPEDIRRLLGMLANPSTRDYAREALSSRLPELTP